MSLTPRSLFNIILKIFGLFFVKDVIEQILTTLSFIVRYFSVQEFATSFGFIVASLFVLALYVILAYQLLVNTNYFIDALKLDKGFTEHEFSLGEQPESKISLSAAELLMIALVVLGGYILVDSIPAFCKQLYVFIDEKKDSYRSTTPSFANILESGAKIILGLLILGERNRIINIILNKKGKEPLEEQ
ncbi:MAG: hypothetical protein QM764_02335 [Chitinophagaceae bacterium]